MMKNINTKASVLYLQKNICRKEKADELNKNSPTPYLKRVESNKLNIASPPVSKWIEWN